MTASSEHLERPDHLALAADFPAATREDWQALAAAVLRKSGAADDRPGEQLDAREALTRLDDSGLPVAPIYGREDVDPALLVRPDLAEDDGQSVGWDVRQRHGAPDSNAAILTDLENGAGSLWLDVGPGRIEDLARALDGVYLDLAPVVLDAGAGTLAAADALLALSDDVQGNLGADPVGLAVRTTTEPDLRLLADAAARTAGHDGLRGVVVDASAFHDAGATDVDQLALATATGVAYLRALTAAGLSEEAAFDQIEFRFAVTDDQFGSIALLRAARRLWARVGQLSGVAVHQRQHAVTSRVMMTRRDPWVNLLRTTVACMAAAVGGAQAITVAPYDAAIGQPVELARRLARNTQAILHDESSLARVADPAGGSWFVESLTDQLATAAWTAFTAVERDGGIVAVLPTLADRVAPAVAARAERIAHRSRAITGVSEFPDLAEPTVARTDPPPDGYRYAEAFEALRDRSDAHLAEHGERPTVVLAAIGPQSAYAARAGFATNLFAAGGVAVELRTDHGDVTGRVVCLCSSERVYDEEAAGVVEALRAAGAATILLAGAERDGLDVDGYVYTGCDALAVLDEVWKVTA